MYQNPDKYDEILKDIIRKVYEASPLFQQKIDQLKSDFNHYSDLCKKEEKLKQKKIEESNLLENGAERCRKARETLEISIERYKRIQSKLRNIAIQEAKLAVKNGQNPLIFSVQSFKGQSFLIRNSRIKSRLISLKTKIMKEYDHLCELQKNAYCLDEFTDPPNYNAFLNDNFQDFTNQYSEFFANQLMIKRNDFSQKTSQYLLDHFQAQYQPQLQKKSQNSITQISDSISPSINQFNFQTSLPFYFASFKPQFQKETEKRKFDIYLSKVASNFNKIISSNIETGEKIDALFNEINTLYQKRQEIINNFYLSKQEYFPVKIISCIGTLIKSSEALRKAQSLIDTLNILITTNASVPPLIWENENHIRTKMNKLLNSLDRISNLLSKTQKFVKIDEFGYSNYTSQIVLDEVSQTQINQCKELISELEDAFTNLEKEKYQSIIEIQETINHVSKIKQDKKDEEENNEFLDSFHKELSASLSDLSLIEDEHLPEIIQTRDALLKKQNEELRKLMDIIKTIPDELKEINFNQEDIDFKFKPLPTIQLPPVLNDEEDESADSSQLLSSTSSFIDDISETNAQYIEQIKAKNFGQQTTAYLSTASQNRQDSQNILNTNQNQSLSESDSTSSLQQKIKMVKNERLETFLSSAQPKVKAVCNSHQYQSLIEKKDRLIEHINDFQNKLEYIRRLKSDIENMEKQIKNFPSYKDRKLKELDQHNNEISELKEEIIEKENSQEYKQYQTLCETLEALQKEYDDLD